jgi:hypothetical protein
MKAGREGKIKKIDQLLPGCPVKAGGGVAQTEMGGVVAQIQIQVKSC